MATGGIQLKSAQENPCQWKLAQVVDEIQNVDGQGTHPTSPDDAAISEIGPDDEGLGIKIGKSVEPLWFVDRPIADNDVFRSGAEEPFDLRAGTRSHDLNFGVGLAEDLFDRLQIRAASRGRAEILEVKPSESEIRQEAHRLGGIASWHGTNIQGWNRDHLETKA